LSSGAQICTSVSNTSMCSASKRDWISFVVVGFGLLSFAFVRRSFPLVAALALALALTLALKRLLMHHSVVSSSACLPLWSSYLFSGS
jgi:hypothetical protein